MRYRIYILAALTVAAFAAYASAGQPRFDESRLAQIPKRMEQFVKEGQISGAVTLVATKDRVVHLAAVGKADVAAGWAVEPGAVFRVASMTKPITPTAPVMVVEQRELAAE